MKKKLEKETQETIIIDIPKNTRFISQYPEIQDFILKDKPILINKKLTGCGMSSYFLSKDSFQFPIILISPRKFMIQSKVKNPSFTHLIEFRPEKLEKEPIQKLKNRLKNEIQSKLVLNEIPKIICTYDAFKYVKECIVEMGLLDYFRFIVDEQQDIIKDSAFKGNTIRTFIKELEGLNKVIYISATPTPKEYNDKISILKDIETIELNWNKEDLRKINFNLIPLGKKDNFINVVRKYKDNFDKNGYFRKKTINGQDFYSRELCIYVSNVELIIQIIKALGLTNENTDVICSENDKTKKKLYDRTRKVGVKKSGFKPAKPKQIGETHKTYTFITRCSYEGADFYSTNSTTIILSNPSIDCMCIDIGIDLYQIVGRERLSSNVFRDDITLYSIVENRFTSFEEMRSKKMGISTELFEFYQNKTQYQDIFFKSFKLDYSNDYLELDENNKPHISELRMLAEDYAESVRLEQFKGEKYIFKTFNEGDYRNKLKDSDIETLNQFYNKFYYQFNFTEKMKILCEFLDKNILLKPYLKNNSNLPQKYLNYYELLGSDVCKSVSYREHYLQDRIEILQSENNVRESIMKNFKVGSEYEVNQVKQILNDIYKQFNLKKKAKSTDLKRFFNITNLWKRNNDVNRRLVKIEGIKQTI